MQKKNRTLMMRDLVPEYRYTPGIRQAEGLEFQHLRFGPSLSGRENRGLVCGEVRLPGGPWISACWRGNLAVRNALGRGNRRAA